MVSLRKLSHAINKDVFSFENSKFSLKIQNFHLKNFDSILIFAQNIDFVYTFEPPR